MFEVLGPLIELSGYAMCVVALLAGTINWSIFFLFLALALLYGLVLTLGSIALEDAASGRFPAWDDLGRVLLFALAENVGYRQLMHLWRLEGFWQLIRKGEWGAMERKGLSDPVPSPAASQVKRG